MGGHRAIRYRCEYVALVVIAMVVGVLPWSFTRWAGWALGQAFYLFDHSHRRLAITNLQTVNKIY